MVSLERFRKLFRQIQVVRPPRHRLATFGGSTIEYLLVTDVTGLPDRSRLRTGKVTAEKPALITPQALKERFSGFGEEATEYAHWLINQYGEAIRGLEYQFRNEPLSNRVELTPPDSLLNKLSQEFDRASDVRQALIRGNDKYWEMSIMKFIVEETMTSFHTNMQELHERGYFEGDDRAANQRAREIKNLLARARYDKSLLPRIGQKLKEYDLFEEFQDEFFKLVKP